jgi:putative ABC transport system permease protein
MLTATIRGMLAHKLRLILTTASIALGVAFLAGTLILTDTMHKAFDQLFGKVSAGTDAVVRQESAYSGGLGASHKPIPASVLQTVRGVAGVRAAEGSVGGYALITDTQGKAILASEGSSTMGMSMPVDEGLRGDVRLRTGHAPTGGNQVVIDARSADEHHVPLGSTVKILFHGPTEAFTVVGTATFGDAKDLGGSTVAYFDTATAQRVLGSPGAYDQINVAAVSGVSQTELTKRLNAAVPDKVEALSGTAIAKEFSDEVNKNLGFVTIMFSVFAGIALFVGSFIIWNTFTMIVTQRSREIALLRAVGSTRGQVMRSLLLESLLLGLGASAVGIGLGIGVAKGLTALMDAVGFSLPTTSTQLQPRTIWLSLLVGTLVTVVAALMPARRATKVLPIEALREATPGSSAPTKKRALAGVIVTGAGLGSLFAGLYGGAGMALFGLGMLLTVLGVTTLAPLAVRPLASVIGIPLRLRGLPGDLARQNAVRNPRRTASTAAALMIGLTLVVSIGVLASSLKGSFGSVLSGSTKADLIVTRTSVGGSGFSTEVAKAVAKVPGVATVSSMGLGEARFGGNGATYSSIDPATADKVLNLEVSAGRTSDLGTNGVMVRKETAIAHGWKVGSAVTAEFASTGKHQLRVTGIYDHKAGFIDNEYILSLAAQDAYDGTRLDMSAMILIDRGADRSTVQKGISAALVSHPDAKVLTQKEYEKDAGGFIDKLLIFVTVMLLLAVIIALLGIVNTLALSVFERTRELGLLRAVGMTRNQIRAMVRWESVVISLIGAAAGAGLGVGLGVALVRAMKDQGINSVVIPGSQIALYVGLAAIAGVVAAIGPARSAAKVDVLKAVVTD